jgi:hypothetical protein
VISTVGAIFGLLVLAGLLGRRELLPWGLSAAVCLQGSIGIIIAGENVQAFYIVATALIATALRGLHLQNLFDSDLTAKPGLRPLVAFTAWALLVTATAPAVFAGIEVLNPRNGIDDSVADPAALDYQISNLAQSGYLIFGVVLVIVLGSQPSLNPRLPAAGLAIGTVLSSVKELLPIGVQQALFDNSPNVHISDELDRMRGIFPEPSALGGFSVTAAVFFVVAASQAHGWRRYPNLALGLWALINAFLSGSGTALVGGLLILGVILLNAVYQAVVGLSRVSPGALVVAILAVPSAIIAGPSIYASANGLVGDKVDSTSYANRTASDLFSLNLTGQTYGIGVGVGANRPSSFLAALLSTTGVLGAALFVVAFVVILRAAIRSSRHQAAAWALVALMFSKVVAVPDLSEPLMWTLLAVCAHAAWPAGATGRAHDPGGPRFVAVPGHRSADVALSTRSVPRRGDVAVVGGPPPRPRSST